MADSFEKFLISPGCTLIFKKIKSSNFKELAKSSESYGEKLGSFSEDPLDQIGLSFVLTNKLVFHNQRHVPSDICSPTDTAYMRLFTSGVDK